MFKSLFKKFGKKGKIPTKAQVVKTTVHPARDWMTMFVIFLIINLVLAIYSLFLFLDINSGSAYVLEEAGGVRRAKIDRQKLEETLVDYENRQATLESLADNPPKSADPSL